MPKGVAVPYFPIAALGSVLLLTTSPVAAQTSGARTGDPQTFALHGQATFVVQGVGGFASPYSGPNSLTPRQVQETADVTAYLGVAPWQGAEVWANPEIDQGFGLSNTLGAAGFPSAEAYKVGKSAPYFRLQRVLFRQTIALGSEREAVLASSNQLGGARPIDRLVLTVGKIGVGDVFDTNRYAHDPRADFLNWSVVDAGSFDYAADAWGYSTGAALEAYRGPWTIRVGAFNLSRVPNGETLERGFGQYQLDGEVEHRHSFGKRAGTVRLGVFRNRGQFGRFDDALALGAASAAPADTALVRGRRTRVGAYANAEQELSDTLGIFGRLGWSDGGIEPYDFTDIDRTAQVGAVLAGKGWGRSTDRVGLALVVNGISAEHQRYLAAGGIGVLVGDARLPDAGSEQIAELYYDVHVLPGIDATLDAQHIANPGYNRDRGPANIAALRLHGAF
ncbi:carbohydrate porin [Sphingomonas sp. AAP5]|uniref:carbohydrate porin n=1 Tax=Sphingomonas sp. AAP5 TaxID=1523415 RepID=UPI001056EB8B|nr:carbohydrate porin [Sphingomonas sp. AAP5]QBM75482.1 carbohydrate porin [Sphingomonas sp. AAP5]